MTMPQITGAAAAPTRQFWCGFASALAAVFVVQQITRVFNNSNHGKGGPNNKNHNEEEEEKEEELEDSTQQQQQQPPQQVLMDTPELDQRMIRKAEAVLQWRTSRVTVVVERCTNDHNYSAILRTAEALGVQNIWIVDPPPPPTLLLVSADADDNKKGGKKDDDDDDDDDISKNITVESTTVNSGRPVPTVTKEELNKRALHHLFAQRANEWLTVREFETTAVCLQELRTTGHEIWVTDLSQEAVCMTPEGLGLKKRKTMKSNDTNNTSSSSSSNGCFSLPKQLAIVFGTEAVGCSDAMLQGADKRVYLPLRGFADSLNLSVATALCLHQLFVLDSAIIGDMPSDERYHLRKAWYTQLCKQRLLTPKQKKNRTRLQTNLKHCDKILAKQNSGQRLEPGEIRKLNQREQFQKELLELEQQTNTTTTNNNGNNNEDKDNKIRQAIQDLIDNPPDPLTDLRRADTHRVCFVGKNTKQKHKEHWKNMAATSNVSTEQLRGNSSNFFRNRLQQVLVDDPPPPPSSSSK